MADRFRFVDSVASAPGLRLDLNDLAIWEVFEPDLSSPPLRRGISQSALLDGGSVPYSSYDLRTITLSLDLSRATQDLAATQRQLLARELARPLNILEYRPDGATASVFFKTFRSETEKSTRFVSGGAYQTYELPILAEPAAYGLKETLPNITLANNPASANGLEFTVAAADAKGDVETPLCMKWANMTKFSPSGINGGRTILGVRRRGTVASMPYVFQAEAATQGTDTATQANSALYSGAGNNSSLCTFATTPGLTTRLTFIVPAAATKEARGTYRVFVKYRTTGAVTGQLMFQYGTFSQDLVDLVESGAITNAHWLDLGLLGIPGTNDPVYDGATGTELAVGTESLRVLASQSAGAGDLVFDHIVLLPADDNHAQLPWGGAGPSTSPFTDSGQNGYVDGINRVLYVGTDTRVDTTPGAIGSATGFPMITPNQDNRICIIPDANTTISGFTTLGQTWTVTPYYWPRYLDVRPAST